jgi:hypothetical protein
VKYTRIQFSSISLVEQRALFEETIPSWERIFGVPASDLEGYWFGKKSRETIVHVLRGDRGEVVGTCTLKYYDVPYKGRSLIIVKIGVGTLPEARGGRFTLRCVLVEALHHAVKYAGEEVYFFSTMIHPVTYQLASRVLGGGYPAPSAVQDPELAELAQFLAEHFGLPRAASEHPFVFREGRSTVESADERERWRRKTDPAVRFFLDTCPNYARGECFIFLAPVPVWIAATAGGSFVKAWLRQLIERRLRRGQSAARPAVRARTEDA